VGLKVLSLIPSHREAMVELEGVEGELLGPASAIYRWPPEVALC